MGNRKSTVSKEEMIKDYNMIKSFKDKNIGNIQMYKHKNKSLYVIKKKLKMNVSKSKNLPELFEKRLDSESHENLQNILHIEPERKKTYIYFEFSRINLLDVMKRCKEKNQKIPEEEIWRVLKTMVSLGNFFEDKLEHHPSITLQNIFVIGDVFKLVHPYVYDSYLKEIEKEYSTVLLKDYEKLTKSTMKRKNFIMKNLKDSELINAHEYNKEKIRINLIQTGLLLLSLGTLENQQSSGENLEADALLRSFEHFGSRYSEKLTRVVREMIFSENYDDELTFSDLKREFPEIFQEKSENLKKGKDEKKQDEEKSKPGTNKKERENLNKETDNSTIFQKAVKNERSTSSIKRQTVIIGGPKPPPNPKKNLIKITPFKPKLQPPEKKKFEPNSRRTSMLPNQNSKENILQRRLSCGILPRSGMGSQTLKPQTQNNSPVKPQKIGVFHSKPKINPNLLKEPKFGLQLKSKNHSSQSIKNSILDTITKNLQPDFEGKENKRNEFSSSFKKFDLLLKNHHQKFQKKLKENDPRRQSDFMRNTIDISKGVKMRRNNSLKINPSTRFNFQSHPNKEGNFNSNNPLKRDINSSIDLFSHHSIFGEKSKKIDSESLFSQKYDTYYKTSKNKRKFKNNFLSQKNKFNHNRQESEKFTPLNHSLQNRAINPVNNNSSSNFSYQRSLKNMINSRRNFNKANLNHTPLQKNKNESGSFNHLTVNHNISKPITPKQESLRLRNNLKLFTPSDKKIQNKRNRSVSFNPKDEECNHETLKKNQEKREKSRNRTPKSILKNKHRAAKRIPSVSNRLTASHMEKPLYARMRRQPSFSEKISNVNTIEIGNNSSYLNKVNSLQNFINNKHSYKTQAMFNPKPGILHKNLNFDDQKKSNSSMTMFNSNPPSSVNTPFLKTKYKTSTSQSSIPYKAQVLLSNSGIIPKQNQDHNWGNRNIQQGIYKANKRETSSNQIYRVPGTYEGFRRTTANSNNFIPQQGVRNNVAPADQRNQRIGIQNGRKIAHKLTIGNTPKGGGNSDRGRQFTQSGGTQVLSALRIS